ncbi:hypothetical protein Gohar_027466 [Gossypium harknessii]|uniref:Zinc knuckle CX2CX4HX4C domain-containing protein n=1 Tax=Gossypium harknessii TaxID=34285 RepID=A0A7J9HWA3_9ROSI|nr:hypothetical protein [Gossypium harknessii]
MSLLAEELVMLLVKGSRVVPSSKPTLICTVWTKKLYNPESFRAHMKSIWKTRRKFEIQMVGQNLFSIVFELADDLELILEEFDKKDLLHAIGATFGGVLRSEINENSCRLRVNLDVQRPLRRGIFVSTNAVSKVWVPFKYENLPMFYFGCGRLGHGDKMGRPQEYGELLGGGEMTGKEEGLMGLKEAEESKVGPRKKDQIKYQDKPNWKGTQPVGKIMTAVGEANMRKRKSFDVDLIIGHKENVDSARFKRLKHDNIGEWEEIFSEEMVYNNEQPDIQEFLGSAEASRQADRTQ